MVRKNRTKCQLKVGFKRNRSFYILGLPRNLGKAFKFKEAIHGNDRYLVDVGGLRPFVVVAIAIDLWSWSARGAHGDDAGGRALEPVVVLAGVCVCGPFVVVSGHHQGREVANTVSMQFITGYLVEKSLSVDNIFVFLMLFNYFAIPQQYQKRRSSSASSVPSCCARADPGGRMAAGHVPLAALRVRCLPGLHGREDVVCRRAGAGHCHQPGSGFLRRRMNITDQFDGEKLSTMINGVKHYTPLFVVLVLIGTTDIIFAVDSIPAIFAITSDPFIVLTANIFAILGLRALYFLLADLANRFHLLAYGLALVLVFIGSKMLLIDVYKIPIGYALLVTAVLIAGSIILSLRTTSGAARSSQQAPTER
jgi:tellurite resistance protein TerC